MRAVDRALLHAIERYDVPRLHAALKAGANPNASNDQGVSLPLRQACNWSRLGQANDHDSLTLIQVLLDAGADPAGGLQGAHSCPLSHAVEARSPQVIALLLARGASPYGVEGSHSPLHSAIGQNDREALARFDAWGVDWSARSHTGVSPLDYALEQGALWAVEWLLDRNASLGVPRYDDEPTLPHTQRYVMHALLALEDTDRCTMVRRLMRRFPDAVGTGSASGSAVHWLIDSVNAHEDTPRRRAETARLLQILWPCVDLEVRHAQHGTVLEHAVSQLSHARWSQPSPMVSMIRRLFQLGVALEGRVGDQQVGLEAALTAWDEETSHASQRLMPAFRQAQAVRLSHIIEAQATFQSVPSHRPRL